MEEFHGIRNADNVVTAYKQLYGWNSINTNVWLPSVRELVGTTGTQASNGCYTSAMQGLNISIQYWTDAQGGAQFVYFQQYNANGGGGAILAAVNQHSVWTRSCVFAYADRSNSFYTGTGHSSVADTHAVHPAGDYKKPMDTIHRPV